MFRVSGYSSYCFVMEIQLLTCWCLYPHMQTCILSWIMKANFICSIRDKVREDVTLCVGNKKHGTMLISIWSLGQWFFRWNISPSHGLPSDEARDRPFNLKGGLWFFASFRNYFSDNSSFRILIFLTLGYMTKTLNQIIIFFFHQNQNIFFSNTGNQNNFLEKKHNPPPPSS